MIEFLPVSPENIEIKVDGESKNLETRKEKIFGQKDKTHFS